MKRIKINLILSSLITSFFICSSFAQTKRLKPPRDSRVKSVDLFAVNTFSIYEKVFVYDSLTRAGVEIPPELEDEILNRAEDNLNELTDAIPDLLEDVERASLLSKVKAAASLNRSRRAITSSLKLIKVLILGEPIAESENQIEDDFEDDDQNR